MSRLYPSGWIWLGAGAGSPASDSGAIPPPAAGYNFGGAGLRGGAKALAPWGLTLRL